MTDCLVSGKVIREFLPETVGSPPVAWSPRGDVIAVGTQHGAQLRRAEGLDVYAVLKHEGDVTALDFDSEGRRLLTASEDATVGVWSVADGQHLARLREETALRLGAKIDSLLDAGSDPQDIWDARIQNGSLSERERQVHWQEILRKSLARVTSSTESGPGDR